MKGLVEEIDLMFDKNCKKEAEENRKMLVQITDTIMLLGRLGLAFRTLHEKRQYLKLFWSAFSRIRTKYEEIHISPYSVRMRENVDQNSSEYGHFLRSRGHKDDSQFHSNVGEYSSEDCLRLATFLKKKHGHTCFPVNSANFLRTPFLWETSGNILYLHYKTIFCNKLALNV